jgi:hypothetical protein
MVFSITQLTEYMEQNKQAYSVEIDAYAKYTFHLLPEQELHMLVIDIQDEIKRRDGKQYPFLPILMHLPTNRNQARQKLATVPSDSFFELVCALVKCIEKRNLVESKSFERKQLKLEIEKLEQRATARSMDRNKANSQPLHHGGAISAPLFNHHESIPTPVESRSNNEYVNQVSLELRALQRKFRVIEDQNEELKLMVQVKVSDIKALHEKLACEISKRFELELLLNESKTRLATVSIGIQTDLVESTPKSIKETNSAIKTMQNQINDQHLQLITKKEEVESLQAQLDKYTSLVDNYRKALTKDGHIVQDENAPFDLQSECKEKGIHLIDSIKKRDKKLVISLTKVFLLSCKRISDESERLDSLGLFSITDREYMSMVDARLAEDLSSMMEYAKLYPLSLDPKIIESFQQSALSTLNTIYDMCEVLNHVYKPFQSVEKRLDRLGNRKVSSSIEVEFKRLEENTMSLEALKEFQIRKLWNLVTLSESDGDEMVHGVIDIVNSIVYETRATMKYLHLSVFDLKRVETTLSTIGDFISDAVYNLDNSSYSSNDSARILIRVFFFN